MKTRNILSIHRPGEGHWVGDGFPVHTIFSYNDLGRELTPFLLLDHAGPADFEPAPEPRGVGWHPHRGFETVTIVYDGEVDHEDTAGNGGRIGPGDVQWMTAGSGLLHKEMHGGDFARDGGRFEVLQLWVNLPKKSKMAAPGYQTLLDRDIPVVALTDGARARVISGELLGTKGPAKTFTPITLVDVRLTAGRRVTLPVVDGQTASLYVLDGRVTVNGAEAANGGDLVVLDRRGTQIEVAAERDAKVFLMAGEPINDPIAGYGPFVMNTREEIQQAFADFHAGKLGKVPETA